MPPPGAPIVSKCPLRTIKEIQFGLLSPEEIKAMSVVNIIYPEAQDEDKQQSRVQGVNDSRLGSIDRMFMCGTCQEDMQTCPGHFGHIELAVPVFHVGQYTGHSMRQAQSDTMQVLLSRSKSSWRLCATTVV